MKSVATILLIDSRGDARLICDALAEAGEGAAAELQFESECVDRFELGLEALESKTYSAVLLDLSLPDSQGVEMLKRIRERAPAIPVVVLTGLNDQAVAMEALRAGAQDYLIKGQADGQLIARALRYAIERKRSEDALARLGWLAGVGETALALQHEINNPLGALLMNAELLSDTPLPDEHAELLGAIVTSARRIGEVVKRVSQLEDPRAVEYIKGKRMLDLSSRE
ncbi:MAG: response regulator [Anaerolineae bacterium]|nr:response regulator [Gemmatimonadaceae bacterium]